MKKSIKCRIGFHKYELINSIKQKIKFHNYGVDYDTPCFIETYKCRHCEKTKIVNKPHKMNGFKQGGCSDNWVDFCEICEPEYIGR